MRRRRREIPARLRRRVLERDDYTCRYCGSRRGPLHIDHVIPVCSGGMNTLTNLVTACAGCNLAKGGKLYEENVAYVRRLEHEEARRDAGRLQLRVEEAELWDEVDRWDAY